MALLWVREIDKATRRFRTAFHLAFQCEQASIIETACGTELDREQSEWVEADIVLTVDEQHLVLCPECAAMTVEQVNDAYGKWQRGEPR